MEILNGHSGKLFLDLEICFGMYILKFIRKATLWNVSSDPETPFGIYVLK